MEVLPGEPSGHISPVEENSELDSSPGGAGSDGYIGDVTVDESRDTGYTWSDLLTAIRCLLPVKWSLTNAKRGRNFINPGIMALRGKVVMSTPSKGIPGDYPDPNSTLFNGAVSTPGNGLPGKMNPGPDFPVLAER